MGSGGEGGSLPYMYGTKGWRVQRRRAEAAWFGKALEKSRATQAHNERAEAEAERTGKAGERARWEARAARTKKEVDAYRAQKAREMAASAAAESAAERKRKLQARAAAKRFARRQATLKHALETHKATLASSPAAPPSTASALGQRKQDERMPVPLLLATCGRPGSRLASFWAESSKRRVPGPAAANGLSAMTASADDVGRWDPCVRPSTSFDKVAARTRKASGLPDPAAKAPLLPMEDKVERNITIRNMMMGDAPTVDADGRSAGGKWLFGMSPGTGTRRLDPLFSSKLIERPWHPCGRPTTTFEGLSRKEAAILSPATTHAWTELGRGSLPPASRAFIDTDIDIDRPTDRPTDRPRAPTAYPPGAGSARSSMRLR